MKSILSPQIGPNREQHLQARVHAITGNRTHGTQRLPAAPRGLVAQRAQNGALLTWHLPTRYGDVTGYRIYVGTEKNLAIEVRDRGTRQMLVPLAAGDTPAQQNIFVSVVNGFREGPRRQIQIKALASTDPPAIPPPPTTYLDVFSGGLDKTQSGRPTGRKVP
jgi:hypothetical protein